MWQISVPPVTVSHLGNYILGYLHDSENIGGLPISLKIQIERGPILSRKLRPRVFGAPQCWAFWSNGGCLPIGPIWKIFRNFLYKIPIERGSIL